MSALLPLSDAARTRLRLWLRLLKSSRQIESVLRERLRREFDTTLPRFDVMAALSQHKDGLTMSALSKVLRVSNGNVTGIVERLVSDGLVLRTPEPGDRRAFRVTLSAAGRDAFAVQAAAHAGWVEELLGGLDNHEAVCLARELDKVLAHWEKKT